VETLKLSGGERLVWVCFESREEEIVDGASRNAGREERWSLQSRHWRSKWKRQEENHKISEP